MTELRTERLLLRRPQDGDGEAAVRYLDDLDTAQKMARVPHPYQRSDWDWFMEDVVRDGRGEDVFAITDGQSGAFMGIVSFQTGRTEPVLGYWLGKPFRGRGFMKEAALAMVRHGFDAYGVSSFISGHFEDNPVSGGVLSWLGFEAFQIDEETSLARGEEKIRHVTMRLTAERFEQLHPLG